MTEPTFSEVWVPDTEYRPDCNLRPHPVCVVATEVYSGRTVRVWLDDVESYPPAPLPFDRDDILVVTFFGSGDLQVFRRCGWPRPRHHIDLFTIHRYTTNGIHDAPGVKKIRSSLLAVATHHGISGIDADEKKEMRDLILNGGPYSEAQREAILTYCEQDVHLTAEIFRRMRPTITWPVALLQGRYIQAVSTMLEDVGVPVDTALFQRMADHWEDIQRFLIRLVDRPFTVTNDLADCAIELWPALAKSIEAVRGQTVTIWDDRRFVRAHFILWCVLHGITWPKLESGVPALNEKAFKLMSKVHVSVRRIRRVRDTLSQLKLKMLTIGTDGCNRTLLSPYRACSGRNQPSNAKFIFLVSKWLRGLIRPPPGWVLVYADWGSQEMAICAVLSGDANLLACYNAADAYLMFAEMCAAVPVGTVAALAELKKDKSPDGRRRVEAFKKRFERVRGQFKLTMLMTLYGAGAMAIALAINGDREDGARLLTLHQRTFPKFWRWRDAVLADAALHRRLVSVLGWQILVHPDTKPTTLGNFHGQAGGCEMMQLACIHAIEHGVQISAPVHDALVVLCREEDLPATKEKLREAMDWASRTILDGFVVRVDMKEVRHPDDAPLVEDDDRPLWDAVMAFLDHLDGKGPDPTPRFAPLISDLNAP